MRSSPPVPQECQKVWWYPTVPLSILRSISQGSLDFPERMWSAIRHPLILMYRWRIFIHVWRWERLWKWFRRNTSVFRRSFWIFWMTERWPVWPGLYPHSASSPCWRAFGIRYRPLFAESCSVVRWCRWSSLTTGGSIYRMCCMWISMDRPRSPATVTIILWTVSSRKIRHFPLECHFRMSGSSY